MEEDRQRFEANFESKTNYINQLEFKIMENFDTEILERKELERKLISLIDEKSGILRTELAKESKNRNESIENFSFYLENEIPKIVEQMKNEQYERDEFDNRINATIGDESSKYLKYLTI